MSSLNEWKPETHESCNNCRLLWEDNYGKPVCCNDGLPLNPDFLDVPDHCDSYS